MVSRSFVGYVKRPCVTLGSLLLPILWSLLLLLPLLLLAVGSLGSGSMLFCAPAEAEDAAITVTALLSDAASAVALLAVPLLTDAASADRGEHTALHRGLTAVGLC